LLLVVIFTLDGLLLFLLIEIISESLDLLLVCKVTSRVSEKIAHALHQVLVGLLVDYKREFVNKVAEILLY
jgi:hypothetical protein